MPRQRIVGYKQDRLGNEEKELSEVKGRRQATVNIPSSGSIVPIKELDSGAAGIHIAQAHFENSGTAESRFTLLISELDSDGQTTGNSEPATASFWVGTNSHQVEAYEGGFVDIPYDRAAVATISSASSDATVTASWYPVLDEESEPASGNSV